jgi:hypothetical protein
MSLLGNGFLSSPSMRGSTVLCSVFTKPVKFPESACFRSYKPGSAVDRFSVLSWNLSERTGVRFRWFTTVLTRSVKYFGSEFREIIGQTRVWRHETIHIITKRMSLRPRSLVRAKETRVKAKHRPVGMMQQCARCNLSYTLIAIKLWSN